MLRFTTCALALFLAGCGTLEERAAAASDYNVCRGVVLGNPQISAVGRAEAARRGLDCTAMAGAIIQAEGANNAARTGLALQLLNQRPAAPMIQPQRVCRSRWVGNQVETICD